MLSFFFSMWGKGGDGGSLNEAIIGAHNPNDEKRISGQPIVT